MASVMELRETIYMHARACVRVCMRVCVCVCTLRINPRLKNIASLMELRETIHARIHACVGVCVLSFSCSLRIGRIGGCSPNLEPETVCVRGVNGLSNGSSIIYHPSSPVSGHGLTSLPMA